LGRSVYFVNDCIGENARTVCEQLQPGDVVLLENTRFYQEEEKGNSEFAKKLSELADCYVNDAFGAAHRAHASTTTVAQFFSEKYAGLLLAAEVENAERVLNTAENPYVAIVGGAKVSDKILIIERLLEKVNTLIIGGGMTYTFLKSQGLEIGKSLCEEEKLDKATELIEKAKKLGVNLVLPVDSVTAEGFSADSSAIVFDNSDLPADRMGLDIGPKSIKNIESALAGAKTILWNGPMGVFEFPAFSSGTFSVARFIAVATQNGAYSLIGGGDSASAVEKAGVADSMSYISTGGGALLEYLEGKILPGVAALD
jgi:phosphoglycerate kinase